ncbi:MAG: cytochrome c peroxidase [Verrucomicrobiales bacterium]
MSSVDPQVAYVLGVLESIPGYVEAFEEAFPDEEAPLTYDNVDKAIGAFERKLMTPAPYLHDGSIVSLEEIVGKMAEYQLGRVLSDEEVALIVTFLGSLKGEVHEEFVAEPTLPETAPKRRRATTIPQPTEQGRTGDRTLSEGNSDAAGAD